MTSSAREVEGTAARLGAGGQDRVGPGEAATRVDMHCHSSASQVSRLGVQRSLGLPECATPPEEVHALAKRRGMDFVTITDHDTIDGVLSIADRPDVFLAEELTAHFRGEPQAAHVLCYGITPEDHEWLQAHSHDLELCGMYLYEREIVCALAHPWYAVGAPLTARHRRRLAELFPVWEIRNGSRARELNRPAAMYVATRDGTGIGGSDDHAGIDIGRTWTEAPPAATWQQFLAHLREGRVNAGGAQGSAAKWAHSAIALAARALGSGAGPSPGPGPGHCAADTPERPDPARVMRMMERLLREADVRHGTAAADLNPADARCLLRAWLAAVELEHLDERGLIAYMQDERFSHSELYRRASRIHERKLRLAVERVVGAVSGGGELHTAAREVFDSCIAAVPYAPSTAFLATEQHKLDGRREDGEPPRVAMIADGIGATHGVSRTIEEIRARGVPGFEVEVVGTDPLVDRRLPAVSELDVPFYPGLRIGIPSLCAAVQSLTDGRFDVIHVCSPGPAGLAGVLLARALGLPLIGSYHTELTAYAGLRSQSEQITAAMRTVVGAFYSACELVLSPSPASDRALADAGIAGEQVLRWDRGVDIERFQPAPARERERSGSDRRINVLYSGRVTREKGVHLMAEAFARAYPRDRRLHLMIAGGGPEQQWLVERLGEHVTPLGWLSGAELAGAYAQADVFLFPSTTDTFGQVILEAQASALPVLSVARGGPLALIDDGRTGLLREPDATALADALVELAGAPALRRRLGTLARASVGERTWESSLELLAAGYRRVLERAPEREAELAA